MKRKRTKEEIEVNKKEALQINIDDSSDEEFDGYSVEPESVNLLNQQFSDTNVETALSNLAASGISSEAIEYSFIIYTLGVTLFYNRGSQELYHKLKRQLLSENKFNLSNDVAVLKNDIKKFLESLIKKLLTSSFIDIPDDLAKGLSSITKDKDIKLLIEEISEILGSDIRNFYQLTSKPMSLYQISSLPKLLLLIKQKITLCLDEYKNFQHKDVKPLEKFLSKETDKFLDQYFLSEVYQRLYKELAEADIFSDEGYSFKGVLERLDGRSDLTHLQEAVVSILEKSFQDIDEDEEQAVADEEGSSSSEEDIINEDPNDFEEVTIIEKEGGEFDPTLWEFVKSNTPQLLKAFKKDLINEEENFVNDTKTFLWQFVTNGEIHPTSRQRLPAYLSLSINRYFSALAKNFNENFFFDRLCEELRKVSFIKFERQVLPRHHLFAASDPITFFANLHLSNRSQKRMMHNLRDQNDTDEDFLSVRYEFKHGRAAENQVITGNFARSDKAMHLGSKADSYSDIVEKIEEILSNNLCTNLMMVGWMRAILNGLDINCEIWVSLKKYEQLFFVKLTFLLFGTEVVRNPASFITHQMMLDIIANNEGIGIWKEMLDDPKYIKKVDSDSKAKENSKKKKKAKNGGLMPMSMKNAVDVSRYLNRWYGPYLTTPYEYSSYEDELPPQRRDEITDFLNRQNNLFNQWLTLHKFDGSEGYESCKSELEVSNLYDRNLLSFIIKNMKQWYPCLETFKPVHPNEFIPVIYSPIQNVFDDKLNEAINKWLGEDEEEENLKKAIKSSLESKSEEIKKALDEETARYGFICKDVDGDGNCFFYAVKHQLQKINMFSQYTHQELRALAVDHILNNFFLYQPFIAGDINVFIDNISQDKEWADFIIILALARALNINIAVIRSDKQSPTIFRMANPVGTIYLGYEVGIHFKSVEYDEDTVFVEKSIDDCLSHAEADNPYSPSLTYPYVAKVNKMKDIKQSAAKTKLNDYEIKLDEEGGLMLVFNKFQKAKSYQEILYEFGIYHSKLLGCPKTIEPMFANKNRKNLYGIHLSKAEYNRFMQNEHAYDDLVQKHFKSNSSSKVQFKMSP